MNLSVGPREIPKRRKDYIDTEKAADDVLKPSDTTGEKKENIEVFREHQTPAHVELQAAFIGRNLDKVKEIGASTLDSLVYEGDNFPSEDQQISSAWVYRIMILKAQELGEENSDKKILPLAKDIQDKLSEIRVEQIKNPQYVESPTRSLSDAQKKNFFPTVKDIQLSVGCDVGCGKCGAFALRTPRKHMLPDDAMADMRGVTAVKKGGLMPYKASNIPSWRGPKGETFDQFDEEISLDKFFIQLTQFNKEDVKRLWQSKFNIALSIYVPSIPYDKFKEAEQNLLNQFGKPGNPKSSIRGAVQKDPLGYLYDFKSVYQKGLSGNARGGVITPERMISICGRKISPLDPKGIREFPVTSSTTHFIDSNGGKDYDPIQLINLEGEKVVLDKLLDFQIEDIVMHDGGILLDGNGYLPGIRTLFENNSENIQNVFSYYAQAIAEYLNKYEPERKVLLDTKKNNPPRPEFMDNEKIDFSKDADNETIQKIIDEIKAKKKETNYWKGFQVVLNRLLHDPNDWLINKFVSANPTRYDVHQKKIVLENA
ncbi:MAG: hypothetical protein NTZ80_04230 [Patescibacteria group bacterium]|nr:hypothetical protein [Patescibacteria group bacterium]